MFSSKGTAARQPAEQPAAAPAKTRRPTREARCFEPSSFASRKAEADAANAARSEPRLVSLGESDYVQRNRRTGQPEVITVKLYVDVDHPMNRYAEVPGHPALVPIHSTEPGGTQTVPLGRVDGRRLSRPESSAYLPSPPDPEPRPV